MEEESMETEMTQKVATVKLAPRPESSVPETPAPELEASITGTTVPASPPDAVPAERAPQKRSSRARPRPISKRDTAIAHMLEERCRQLCLSTFFREQAPVRSLGFTSSIGGEGKSFLSLVTARVLARDNTIPVTLLECNWDHPSLHEYFGFPSTPGLAEWLREECDETAIRYEVDHNLTVIPAGNGRQDAVKLLHRVRQKGLLDTLSCSNELLIVDLPAIVTTGYGSMAASLVESLIVVVRAGVTPESMVAEACTQLKDLAVEGILLNQLQSRIPRLIRSVL